MISLKDLYVEGVYDKYNNKAIIMAGAPGSGKSYLQKKILSGFGLKSVDSDVQFMHILKKSGLVDASGKIDLNNAPDYTAHRKRGIELTDKFQNNYFAGRLGVIVQGTGSDYSKIHGYYNILSEIGYDTFLIYVNVPLETALERNAKRDRTVPEEIVTTKWRQTQANLGKFQRMLKPENVLVFDNVNPSEDDYNHAHKQVMKFLNTPVSSKKALQWKSQQLKDKNRLNGN